MGFTIDLHNVASDFSFSGSMSPSGERMAFDLVNVADIQYHGQHLNPIYIMVLALNEECNKLGHGHIYYTPLREERHHGHPCDLVFINKPWSILDADVWRSMDWAQRLKVCEADAKIGLSEIVIPICARILLCKEESDEYESTLFTTEMQPLSREVSPSPKDDSQQELRNRTTTNTLIKEQSHVDIHYLDFPATNTLIDKISNQKPYDPVIEPGICVYSRPVDDVSTILLRWNTIHSKPFICLTAAAEHESLCNRYPSIGDLSETFRPSTKLPQIRGDSTNKKDTPLYSSVAGRAAKHFLKAGMNSNKDVILRLIELMKADDEDAGKDLAMFGRVKYFWSEILSRIEVDTTWRDVNKLDFWPKE